MIQVSNIFCRKIIIPTVNMFWFEHFITQQEDMKDSTTWVHKRVLHKIRNSA